MFKIIQNNCYLNFNIIGQNVSFSNIVLCRAVQNCQYCDKSLDIDVFNKIIKDD